MNEAKRWCSRFVLVVDSGWWAWSGEPRPVLLPGVGTGAGVPGAVLTSGTASNNADWSYVLPRRCSESNACGSEGVAMPGDWGAEVGE